VREILLVNNNYSLAQLRITQIGMRRIATSHPQVRLRVLHWPQPFNWQKVNNWAARRARGQILCFLNNDVEFTKESRDLLVKMSRAALKAKVGVVGCLMLHPNGTVQHAGGHMDKGFWHSHFGGKLLPKYKKDKVHDFLTGACHVISAKKFGNLAAMTPNFS
jgi:O-antigen biosynthesis protein